ncbi:putative protein [alpha proteobacterium Q-1]|nr:putative protein [alpha proteobacterium Q-1]
MRFLIGPAMMGMIMLLAGCATAPPSDGSAMGESGRSPTALSGVDRSGGDADAPDQGLLAPDQGEIRIALLVPLSGPAADVGAALRDAAALALFDAYDPRLRLLPFDTAGTAEGARLAAQQAVDQGVSVVLGPLLAASVQAVAPLLRQSDIPLLGFSNDQRVAGDGVYLFGFMPDQDVERIVSYAIGRGLGRLAGLIPSSPYGDRILQHFGPLVQEAGGDLVSLIRYEPETDALDAPVKILAHYDQRRAAYLAEVKALEALGDDLSNEILKRLKTKEALGPLGFDALLIAQGDPLLRSLGPLLPYYEIDPQTVQFLGTGLWDEPSLVREPPLRGAWFPAPEPSVPRAFLARFEQAYGRPAPRLATLGYDGMALLATLARNPVQSERFEAAAFEDRAGFSGLDGAFRFGSDGIVERNLAILEIGARDFRIIDPAPVDFRGPRIGFHLDLDGRGSTQQAAYDGIEQ